MRRIGRNRIAVTAGAALLALLAGLTGPLWAGCCTSATADPMPAPMPAPMPGCHEESAPEIHPPCCGGKDAALSGDCCGRIQAAAPATPPTAAPAPPCAPTSPLTFAEPVRQDAAPVRLSRLRPPLHPGVGLFTLYSVFLI